MTVAVKTQGINPAEWLLSEGEGQISRDQVTVTTSGGVGYPSGTTLGKITASGKYTKASDGASDGSQTSVAVLHTDLTGVADGDHPAVVISRMAEAIGSLLNGGTGPNSTDAAELRSQNIIVR